MVHAKPSKNTNNWKGFSHSITMVVITVTAVSPVCYVSGQHQSNIRGCIT